MITAVASSSKGGYRSAGMRRLWLVFVLSLVLGGTGATPATATAPEPCDKPQAAELVAEQLAATSDLPSRPDILAQAQQVSLARSFSPVPCDGVRPGGEIRIPKEDATSSCTLNFLFIGTDARKQKHVYMGTAGHCLLAETNLDTDKGEHAWPPGKGPIVTDRSGKRIGTFAYAILQGKKDFALIRIDNGIGVSPQMCWFGGPTGVNKDITSATVPIHHYGHGVGIGQTVPARTSLAYGMRNVDEVTAVGLVIPGDSGGPAIGPDGRAVGVVVSIGVSFTGDPLGGGTVGITRLTPQLERAAKVLQQRIGMATAKLL